MNIIMNKRKIVLCWRFQVTEMQHVRIFILIYYNYFWINYVTLHFYIVSFLFKVHPIRRPITIFSNSTLQHLCVTDPLQAAAWRQVWSLSSLAFTSLPEERNKLNNLNSKYSAFLKFSATFYVKQVMSRREWSYYITKFS